MTESLIYSLGITLFLSGLSYGLLQSKIISLQKSIEDMKSQNATFTTDIKETRIELTVTKTNLERTYEDVKEMNRKIDKILDILLKK